MPTSSSVLLAIVLLATAFTTQAGEIAFSGILPNGGSHTVRIESMQERRFRNLVRQHTDYSCGAAALATILRHAYHLDVDESTVIAGMMKESDSDLVKQRGFSLLDIKNYVQSIGMRGRGYRVSEDRLKSLRVPGLALMDIRGFRHFVVVKQVHNNIVEIGDPILGNRAISIEEFTQAWPSRTIFIVIGNDFDRRTALLQPSERPSARTLFNRQGQPPISETDLLDFGFTHADLF